MGNNIKEIPYTFRTLFGAPLDCRYLVSSRSKLLEELPLKLRYEGMLVFIQDEHKVNVFIGGINDSQCQPLTGVATTAAFSRMMTVEKNDRIYIDSDSYRYKHNLSTVDIKVILSDDVTSEEIDVDVAIIDKDIIEIRSRLRGFYQIHIS